MLLMISLHQWFAFLCWAKAGLKLTVGSSTVTLIPKGKWLKPPSYSVGTQVAIPGKAEDLVLN